MGLKALTAWSAIVVSVVALSGCGVMGPAAALGGMLGGLGLGGLLGTASQATPCSVAMTPSAPMTSGDGMITFSAPAGTVFMLCAQ